MENGKMVNYVGQQLGNYRLTRVIGQGGFADIYLGEHIHLRTQAAIKVLQMRLAENNVESFLQEARMVAHLIHPHIIRVLDFGLWEMVPFLVMDYAPGGTLRQRHMRGVPLATNTLFPYITQLASALQYAHNNKLIHRDVKPENMLIGHNNEILLSDFGLALLAQSANSLSKKEMSGTVTYMAPEQVQGSARPASDQYSLAVVVYEWLTGSKPFQGSMVEVATQQILTPPPPLRDKVPTISVEVEQVILKALSKNPLQRFATVQEFAQVLQLACRYNNKQITAHIKAQPQPQLAIEAPSFIPEQTGSIKRIAQEPSTGTKTPQAQNNRTGSYPALPTSLEAGSRTGNWATTPYRQNFSTQEQINTGYTNSVHTSIAQQNPQYIQPDQQTSTNTKRIYTQTATFSTPNVLQPLSGQTKQQTSARKPIVSDTTASINRSQKRMSGFSGTTWIVVSLLFIFLLLGGGVAGTFYLIQANKPTAPITITKVLSTPAPTTPPTSIVTPTVTGLYPPVGAATLTDSLSSNHLNWDQNTQCNFVNSAYQVTAPTNQSTICYAQGTDYKNFIYQVQMTFVKTGYQFSAGGIAFRGNNNSGLTYYIQIFESGKFSFTVKSGNAAPQVLAGYPQDTQSIASFHTELGQSNTLAVIANNNDFTFYVNNQLVFGPIQDTASAHGMLGVFAAGGLDDNGTEITFSKVQLWQL
jgi:serine/threonine protein kinase